MVPLRPADRIARLMNYGDTSQGDWHTIAEIMGTSAEENRALRELLLTAYSRLVSAVRRSEGEKLSIWTVRDGRGAIAVWLHRKTQALYAKRTGRRSRRGQGVTAALALAELFLAASGKVLRCADCGRWFGRADARQRHCRPACADRARKRRIRGSTGRRVQRQRANLWVMSRPTHASWIPIEGTSWNARADAQIRAQYAEAGIHARPVPVRSQRRRRRSS